MTSSGRSSVTMDPTDDLRVDLCHRGHGTRAVPSVRLGRAAAPARVCVLANTRIESTGRYAMERGRLVPPGRARPQDPRRDGTGRDACAGSTGGRGSARTWSSSPASSP
jgi:hypothetical protein